MQWVNEHHRVFNWALNVKALFQITQALYIARVVELLFIKGGL